MDEPLSDEFMQQLRVKFQYVQDKINACDLHITVGREVVPLRDCDWVLINSAGDAVSIMSAVTGYETYPDAESAWHELYDINEGPHPHKRVRDAAIKRKKAEGYTVVPMLREDAVKAHRAAFTAMRGATEDTGNAGDDQH
jgi:hypothetical protein